jgi:hypothetical protein
MSSGVQRKKGVKHREQQFHKMVLEGAKGKQFRSVTQDVMPERIQLRIQLAKRGLIERQGPLCQGHVEFGAGRYCRGSNGAYVQSPGPQIRWSTDSEIAVAD